MKRNLVALFLCLASLPAQAKFRWPSHQWLESELAWASGQTFNDSIREQMNVELAQADVPNATSVPQAERLQTSVFYCAGITAGAMFVGGHTAVCLNHRYRLSLNIMAEGGLVSGNALNAFALVFRVPNINKIPGVYAGLKFGAGFPIGLSVGAFRKLNLRDKNWLQDEGDTLAPRAFLFGPLFGQIKEAAGAILWVTQFEMAPPRL